MRTLTHNRLQGRPKALYLRIIIAVIITLLTFSLQAQDYQKSNKKHHRSYYRKQTARYADACNLLEKKRHQKPKKDRIAKSYRTNMKSVLSIDASAVTASAGESRPQVKSTTPTRMKANVEEVSEERLAELHRKEDVVLEKNNLPKPTSDKHEEVRKKVSEKIANKKDAFPLTLDPLYFSFDQDEFSIVDMEPFLIAAEYALQGRTVLIEGHTDSHGQDNYNVKLSIKRVQKIRQLMLDMGVPDDRISIVGYGEEHAKVKDNTTEQSRQLNRRVDFTVF
jgi:outer membrane protein OmpA-like peptidoglycan-associated protein